VLSAPGLAQRVEGGRASELGRRGHALDRRRVHRRQTGLRAIQHFLWQIHQAHCDYQQVAEDRRQLAVDIGEVVRTVVDELVAVGWSEKEARNTNVRGLAGSGREVSR
jgi:hypothetical protein